MGPRQARSGAWLLGPHPLGAPQEPPGHTLSHRTTGLRTQQCRTQPLLPHAVPRPAPVRSLWENPVPHVLLQSDTRSCGTKLPAAPRVHTAVTVGAQRAQTLPCPFQTSSMLSKTSELWPSPARGLGCSVCHFTHRWHGTQSVTRGPQGPGVWAQPPGQPAQRGEPSAATEQHSSRELSSPPARGAAPNLTLPARVLRAPAGERTQGPCAPSGEISGWRGVCGSHMGGGAHSSTYRMKSLRWGQEPREGQATLARSSQSSWPGVAAPSCLCPFPDAGRGAAPPGQCGRWPWVSTDHTETLPAGPQQGHSRVAPRVPRDRPVLGFGPGD